MALVGNQEALDLLNQLDQRQDDVLHGLEELNQRIERVLELYLENRRTGLTSIDMQIDNASSQTSIEERDKVLGGEDIEEQTVRFGDDGNASIPKAA